MLNVLFTLSLAPVVALIILFYIMDRYEPEPKKIVLKVFGGGILMVFPAIILEIAYRRFIPGASETGTSAVQFINIFIGIAFVEELCKFLVIMAGIYRSREFDEPYDGVIYSVAASLGFAALENLLYVFQGGVGVGVLRAILSVPAHALFGGLMGYFIGKARFSRPEYRFLLIAAGLFSATLAHALYDFMVLSRTTVLILCVFPLMALLWLLVFLLARNAEKASFYKYNPQKEDGSYDEKSRCPRCNYSMPEEATFCMQCGVPLEHPESPKEPSSHLQGDSEEAQTCQGCGCPIDRSWRFCTRCGASQPRPCSPEENPEGSGNR